MTCGAAWIKGLNRPITAVREIMRGKNKGRFEVLVGKAGKKQIIDKDQIRLWPQSDVP